MQPPLLSPGPAAPCAPQFFSRLGRVGPNGLLRFCPAAAHGLSDRRVVRVATAGVSPGKHARNLPSGSTRSKKNVQIEGFKEIPFARTTAELAQQAEEAARRGRRPAADDLHAAVIPANTEGSNATIEVKARKQTLDLWPGEHSFARGVRPMASSCIPPR